MLDTLISFSHLLADVILYQSYGLNLLLSHFTDEERDRKVRFQKDLMWLMYISQLIV